MFLICQRESTTRCDVQAKVSCGLLAELRANNLYFFNMHGIENGHSKNITIKHAVSKENTELKNFSLLHFTACTDKRIKYEVVMSSYNICKPNFHIRMRKLDACVDIVAV